MSLSGTATAPSGPRHPGIALGVLGLSQLMVVLDSTIVNVALPSIFRSLRFGSTADLAWVVNAYTLTFGGFLLLGGRVADRYGRRKVFIAGTALFVVGSMAGGLANTSALLVAARAIQGVGGAFMSPAALSLLTGIFKEGRDRDRALGVWAGIAGSGAAFGLLLGGILTSGLSWRWVLFVNVPFGLLAAVAAPRFIPESRDPGAGGFDVVGAVSVTAGLVALVYALVQANNWGWGSASTIGLLLAAAALLAVFIVLQARGRDPLMPLRLFKIRTLAGADLGIFLVGAGLFGMFFFLTLFMQDVLHFSPLKAGFGFLPVSLLVIASATAGANLLTRFGARRVLVVGLSVAVVGMLLLERISVGGSYWTEVLIPMGLFGLGVGACFVSLTSSAVAGVPPGDAGIASALLNSGQQVGGAVGLAILTAVATARYTAVVPHHPTVLQQTLASVDSWRVSFLVSAALLAAAAVVCGTMIRSTSVVEMIGEPVAGSS